MTNQLTPKDEVTDFLIYTTPEGDVRIEAFLHKENIWLTQDKMSELFGVQRPAITKHLKNIFESGELKEEEVSSILEHTTKHGAIAGKTQTNKVTFYNLDSFMPTGATISSIIRTVNNHG